MSEEPIYQDYADGNKIKTNQEWADICFVPEWVVKSKASHRYLVILLHKVQTSAVHFFTDQFRLIVPLVSLATSLYHNDNYSV